jgi:WD40 repeat protein
MVILLAAPVTQPQKYGTLIVGPFKKTLNQHKDYVNVLVLLANGDLVKGSEDQTIKIWNIKAGFVKRTLEEHKNYVYALKALDNGD